ncbi:MAG TPA: PilN domain-containing protein [Thermoanaerobaculia bacterium]|nr:PilN domain-containing protein [Thermoanaerobaculia bacterium]
MIKINLLSEGRTAARAAQPAVATGKVNNLVFIGCLALAVLYFLGMWWHVATVKRDWDEKNRRAQAEVDRLKSIIDEVNGYEKKKSNLEAKINLINDLKRNQHGPVRLMDEVSKALPDLVWLNTMNLIGNAIQINGKAMTPNAVANFIENLKKSPYFAEPRFQSLNQEGPIYNFGLAVTFTYVSPTEPTAAPAGAPATTSPPAAAPPAKPAA